MSQNGNLVSSSILGAHFWSLSQVSEFWMLSTLNTMEQICREGKRCYPKTPGSSLLNVQLALALINWCKGCSLHLSGTDAVMYDDIGQHSRQILRDKTLKWNSKSISGQLNLFLCLQKKNSHSAIRLIGAVCVKNRKHFLNSFKIQKVSALLNLCKNWPKNYFFQVVSFFMQL